MAGYSSMSSNRQRRTPPLSQDEDSADERKTPVLEECLEFDEENGHDGFLIRDSSSIVRVNPSKEQQQSDNSKFRFKLVVDYAWEAQYLPGRLVATHIGNKFVAYIVHAKGVGAVRIMDLVTQERCLMKADKGAVKDVEFMHKEEDIYIGFIDEHGTFYINRIHQDVQTGKLSYHQILKVTLDSGGAAGTQKTSDFRRFLWCKFVPDELVEVASVKDCAYQFAVLEDDMIYAGNLAQIISKHEEGAYSVNEIRNVLITIDTHSGPVTDASFAPDGTALATASKDGTVKFFQMYFQDKEQGTPPRCLYSWEPHQGRPIDRLLFLDNHSIRPSAESQYWKFMVTFSENMTEMKLFTCKTWECLQTIHFSETGQWKMEIDITAHYLLATDIRRKTIFLLHFQHNDETARVDWIRELMLPFNVLSFNLTNATPLRMQEIRTKGYTDCVAGRVDDYKQDAELIYVQTNIVQPKSLQQGVIAIDPPQTYCRSSNGHGNRQHNHRQHHISFQPHVSYKEAAEEPTLADEDENEDIDIDVEDEDEDGDDLLLAGAPMPVAALGNKSLPTPEEIAANSPVLSLLRKKSSLSPIATAQQQQGSSNPSVAQMSEQLSSLIGISPSLGGAVRSPSSGGACASSSRKSLSPSPAPARHSSSRSVDEYLIPHELTVNPSSSSNNNNSTSNPTNGTISKASSSSSPSREVEEILSPKNTSELISSSHRNAGGEPITSEDILLLTTSTKSISLSLESIENGNYLPTCSTGGTAPTATKQQTLKNPHNPANPHHYHHSNVNEVGLVSDKVASMVDMIGAQATEMQDLKREMGRLNVSLKQNDELHALRKLVEACLKDNQQRMNRLEEIVQRMEAQERVRSSSGAGNNPIPPNIAEVLAVSIGNVVKKEVHAVVPETLERIFEPGRMTIQTQIDNLTSVLEAKLTQNINLIFQREKIWENLSANFRSTTKTIFEQTFNEIFTNTVYPRCQNVAKEMFNQVNEAFMEGTGQYLNGLQKVLEVERKKDNTNENLRSHINNMQDALSSALQVEVEAQMLRVISGLQGSVVRQLEESITRELAHAFQEQKKYFEISVLPRTVTPAVSVTDHGISGAYGMSPNLNDPEHLKRSLLNLAKSGEIVQAFVQACNFGDVNVIMHLCKNLNPQKVFENKLPHQTHISILQNMAMDIQNDTTTKLEYLQAAIGSLDISDQKTFQSVARVIPVFQASVAKYIARNPDSRLISNIKILEMAIMGLCQQYNSPQIQQSHSAHAHHQQGLGSGGGSGQHQHSFGQY